MSKLLKFLLQAILSFSLLTSVTFGQYSLLYQKDGDSTSGQFGNSVASAGDVNGDGKSDFIIGAHNAHPGGNSGAGSAYVYSGADGALLYQKDGAASFNYFGRSVAGAGDVNGDGKADFIIGAPGAGSAFLYSGDDGSVLYQKNGTTGNYGLGFSVSGAGDVNGDGRADFIIGDPGFNPGGLPLCGAAFVYSGADGSLLYQKGGITSADVMGSSVASAGDVDGDGRADFIVGRPTVLGGNSSAYVYSGATGALLYQKNSAALGEYLGSSVASAGDVNGDGRADFIIGAPNADAVGFDMGSAYVYSGATGGLLYQKNGAGNGEYLGTSVASAGDVNGDGRADFIIGAIGTDPGGNFEAGSAYVYSGTDGTLLYQKDGAPPNDNLGRSVAGAGDVNGDGKADFIIGAPYTDPGGRTDAGSAYVYGVACAAAKGDMNADAGLAPADVVLMLNCVYLASGSCDLCFADVNCSADLSPSDVVVELNSVYLGAPLPC